MGIMWDGLSKASPAKRNTYQDYTRIEQEKIGDSSSGRKGFDRIFRLKGNENVDVARQTTSKERVEEKEGHGGGWREEGGMDWEHTIGCPQTGQEKGGWMEAEGKERFVEGWGLSRSRKRRKAARRWW